MAENWKNIRRVILTQMKVSRMPYKITNVQVGQKLRFRKRDKTGDFKNHTKPLFVEIMIASFQSLLDESFWSELERLDKIIDR